MIDGYHLSFLRFYFIAVIYTNSLLSVKNYMIIQSTYQLSIFTTQNMMNLSLFFSRMAEKHKMKLVYRKTFSEFYNQHIETAEGRGLMIKMQGLEVSMEWLI